MLEVLAFRADYEWEVAHASLPPHQVVLEGLVECDVAVRRNGISGSIKETDCLQTTGQKVRAIERVWINLTWFSWRS